MTVSNQTFPETRRDTSGLFTRTNRTLTGLKDVTVRGFLRHPRLPDFKKHILTTTLSILIQYGRSTPPQPRMTNEV